MSKYTKVIDIPTYISKNATRYPYVTEWDIKIAKGVITFCMGLMLELLRSQN